MSIEVRLFLIIGAVLTAFFVLKYIRKSRVKIEDTFFWLLLSIVLVIISVFPHIVFILSDMLKMQSPINFVFLIIIFLLLVKQFFTSIKLSQLEIKIKEIAQATAIDKTNDKDNGTPKK